MGGWLVNVRNVVPPLFLFEGSDVISFDSIARIEGFVEPLDVDESDVLFDSQGTRLNLATDGKSTFLSSLDTNNASELESRLSAYLRSNHPTTHRTNGLAAIVRVVHELTNVDG